MHLSSVFEKPESEGGATWALCKWSICTHVTPRRMPLVSLLQVATGGGWKMTNLPCFPVRYAVPKVHPQMSAAPSLSKRQSYSCCTSNRDVMGRVRLPLWSLFIASLFLITRASARAGFIGDWLHAFVILFLLTSGRYLSIK
jgi:hypothetical protein